MIEGIRVQASGISDTIARPTPDYLNPEPRTLNPCSMKILVSNIGSTSFKFRLFDMPSERELARGGVDSVGSKKARCYFRGADTEPHEQTASVRDQGDALARCLKLLTKGASPVLQSPEELDAVGFKAVLAKGMSGVQLVNKNVLRAMEAFADVAPAHNPPYVAAMRTLRKRFPELPLVAAFETGFHDTIPDRNRSYAVPYEWAKQHHILRNGFHGASHRYIAGRLRELTGRDDLRLISCHLGGSSSVSAIRAGESVANSFGFSAQSGLPHNNRVGDLDPYALLAAKAATGKPIKKLLADLAERGGLAGLSGTNGDLREIERAAASGDSRAKLAIDVFVAAVRHYVGAYLVELGGADAIAFTGGIGENSPLIRESVCRDMAWCGVQLDADRNQTAKGEAVVSADASRAAVWILPTNEELVVARQVVELLNR
jgi:acetate kinase